MTDHQAPERIWVCPQYEEKAFHDFEFGGWPEYVRADLLEAARAEALEEAAKVADNAKCDALADAIRDLKEKPNG